MATPAYSGGGYRRGWGSGRHWVQTPGTTDNGWLDRVGAWFDGVTPQYAGQPAPATVRSGTPLYKAPPPTTATADPATTTPQAESVIVAPHT